MSSTPETRKHFPVSWEELHRNAKALAWRLIELGPPGPVVAATDYMKIFADQIRPFIYKPYVVLGTDGFGRSDYRRQLRKYFEVDRYYVTVAALKALADEGSVPASTVAKAIKKYAIDPGKPNPVTV